MPDTAPPLPNVIPPQQLAPRKAVGDPAPEPAPFTCEWAQQGLAKALAGWTAATSGVEGYGIGTRWVRYKTAGDQRENVDVWSRLVAQYCGSATPLPGANSACRIILRDV